jgi:hypothetical protein
LQGYVRNFLSENLRYHKLQNAKRYIKILTAYNVDFLVPPLLVK